MELGEEIELKYRSDPVISSSNLMRMHDISQTIEELPIKIGYTIGTIDRPKCAIRIENHSIRLPRMLECCGLENLSKDRYAVRLESDYKHEEMLLAITDTQRKETVYLHTITEEQKADKRGKVRKLAEKILNYLRIK